MTFDNEINVMSFWLKINGLILSICIAIIIIMIIIIIRGQFIKGRKWWFDPPHQGRFDIFNDEGQRVR